MNSSGFKHWLLILCFPIISFAQFVEVNAEISVERMPEKERADLKVLERLLPAYFESFQWIENSYGMQIPIKISIFPQSVGTAGAERVFTAQMFITNESGDQRFFEKSFKFVYNPNDPVVHSDMSHSLTSVLDYYAWMLIAGELDTYELLGGNNAYEKARDIATRAQMSERPQGWKERLQVQDEILRQRNYRMTKYYFWLAVYLSDQKKTAEVPAVIDKALGCIEATFSENSRERNLRVFLDAHARDFMLVIKEYGSPAQQRKLLALDPDNKAVYDKILSERPAAP